MQTRSSDRVFGRTIIDLMGSESVWHRARVKEHVSQAMGDISTARPGYFTNFKLETITKAGVASASMETATTTSLSEIKARMAETNGLFNVEVMGKRNFDALDRIYTSNARILPPVAPMISGRQAIKKFWSDMVTGANAKAAELSSIDVMAAGDGVVEIGRALLTVAPLGQPEAQIEVKYVVYWREEDGAWRWHVDIWNTNS